VHAPYLCCIRNTWQKIMALKSLVATLTAALFVAIGNVPKLALAKAVCSDESGVTYSFHTAPPTSLVGFVCFVEGPQAVPSKPADAMRSAHVALALPWPVLVLAGAERATANTRSEPSLRLAMASQGGMRWADNAAAPRPADSHHLDNMIHRAAQQYGHDANLLKAIIHVESRFNPHAVSPKGAIGLMQVMPATGRRVGISTPHTMLFDPAMNLQAGARYLRILMDMFADRPELAVAAYNAGEGAVLRHKRGIPPFPETQAYVRDVMAHYKRYSAL
jgi:soluble lytic murein transglycosylase-like protein